MEETKLRQRAKPKELKKPIGQPKVLKKTPGRFRLCKNILYFIVAIIVGLYLYNKWALTMEAPLYDKPPEKMIKLPDGHSMYLNCEGNGSPNKPVIVLIMGFINTEIMWYRYQQLLVADGWRVCTYDRSGIAWSEPSPNRFVTVQGYVEELRDLLMVSGITKGPYALVGLSMGAAITARYLEHWPEDTHGGYLMDPPIFTEHNKAEKLMKVFDNFNFFFKIMKYLSEYGLLRPFWYFGTLLPITNFDDIPQHLLEPYRYLAARPNGFFSGILHEMEILEPGHGYMANTTTFEFLAKYDRIPIHVELREKGFVIGLTSQEVDDEWRDSRQILKEILKHKQTSYDDDHLGNSKKNEPRSAKYDKLYSRLKNWLKEIIKV